MDSVRSAGESVFEARTPIEFRVIPFVILMPSLVAVLVEPVWWVIALVAGLLALLVWAAFAARVSVRVGARNVDIAGPFYRRSIPVDEIAEVSLHRESVADHSLIQWPVAGLASSPVGVRIGLGGMLGVRMRTTGGETYKVFLGTTSDGEACVAAVAAASAVQAS
ncbi:hypothetical protein [Corynebacterium variabile]|uniref:DUF3093 domain-containing protein n=1 Tax=Corynebacterium variabile TaxID=1727 RepID=A0A4Y4C2J9_9CORY|nr:hypothetical protein [Corynebacterium variabile]MDN6659509.1 hypothetical protein [Acidipropionibacterium jensenii]MDN6675321.1 hypothetical protein [Corynebacterium variabile]MDN6843290.1 hypothetical protein [Corynebacterium variabile]GEC85654.1 hypothetical protein CVA01_09680 [Corynebacterium variabile]